MGVDSSKERTNNKCSKKGSPKRDRETRPTANRKRTANKEDQMRYMEGTGPP